MRRLVRFFLVLTWLVGAALGGLTGEPSESPPEDERLHLLVDTDHARLGVTRSRVFLVSTTSWESEWCLSAPLPETLIPRRPEQSSSDRRVQAPPPPPLVSLIIRLLASP